MKVGLSIYSLYSAIQKEEITVEDAIQWMGENGAEHLEIVSFVVDVTADEAKCDALAAKIKEAGLYVSAYCTSTNVLAEGEELEEQLTAAYRHIDTANRLGAKILRCDLTNWGRPNEEATIEYFDKDLPRLIEGARKLADYAKQYGMIITVENHGMYINGGDRLRRLILGVDRENYRCTLDIGNALCVDEDPLVCLETLLPYAATVHFKDFYIRTDKDVIGEGPWITTPRENYLRGSIVGHGDIDVGRVMARLKASGYNGDVAIEFEGMEDCRAGSKTGMDNVRRLSEK